MGPISDIDAEFDLINKDGGDEILFAEFIDWALGKDLDIEDDHDFWSHVLDVMIMISQNIQFSPVLYVYSIPKKCMGDGLEIFNATCLCFYILSILFQRNVSCPSFSAVLFLLLVRFDFLASLCICIWTRDVFVFAFCVFHSKEMYGPFLLRGPLPARHRIWILNAGKKSAAHPCGHTPQSSSSSS